MRLMTTRRRVLPRPPMAALALLVMAAGLAGCAGYQLQGKVIEGTTPIILIVSKDDHRLNQTGLAGATITATLDPDTLDPKPVGSAPSAGDGSFTLPVGHGAGFLLYDAHIVVRRSGYVTAEHILPLPKKHQRLLVTLPPGRDTWKPKTDVMEETLEMGRPYMDE